MVVVIVVVSTALCRSTSDECGRWAVYSHIVIAGRAGERCNCQGNMFRQGRISIMTTYDIPVRESAATCSVNAATD